MVWMSIEAGGAAVGGVAAFNPSSSWPQIIDFLFTICSINEAVFLNKCKSN